MVIHNYANFFILKSCKKLLSKFGKYSNELAYLMNYLKSGIDPYDFPNYLGRFYNSIGKKIPKEKEEFDILYEMTKQEKDDYKKWLEDIISKGKITPDALSPSYLHMEYRSIINPNTWLIHFTNNAYAISRRGFRHGTEDMNTLGLTTHLTKKEKGWNFAFEPLSKHAGYAAQNKKYGKNAVLFRGAAGVKVYHYGDEEEQIIFVGENARDIVPLFRSEQGWTVESTEDEKPLVEGNYEKVVSWVMNNYEQYKRI